MKFLANLTIKKLSQQFLLLIALLFVLAPCSVKASALKSIEIDYQKPLNKTKVAASKTFSNCNAIVVYNSNSYKKQDSKQFLTSNIVLTKPVILSANYYCLNLNFLNFSDNNPPLYILFKRLKYNLI